MQAIHHELLIGASVGKVYEAITSREGLSAWWMPGATRQLGGIIRFAFGPDYFKEMKVVELVPDKLVKWDCVKGAEEWMGTTITFKLQAGDKESLLKSHPEIGGQLEQQGDKKELTLLIFHHDDWKADTPMFAECNYTWALFLRSLKLFCETGKGRPWPDQHGVE